MEQETRIAVVGIIVENKEAVGEVNQILHDYSPYIIGRMGLPYEKETCEHHQRYRRRSSRPDQRAFRETWKNQGDQRESNVFEEGAVGGESHAPKLPYK